MVNIPVREPRTARAERARPSVAAMVESIVGCKWSVRLLSVLATGPVRPSALRRRCPGLSAKVMNERLAKFARFGLTQRRVLGDKPPVEVEYSLTPLGAKFGELLAAVDALQRELDAAPRA